MAIPWPAGFPVPLRDDYAYEDANLLQRTAFANGARSRRIYQDGAEPFNSVSFVLSAGQWAEFQGWFKRADGANAGAAVISMPIVASGTKEMREVQIIPPNRYRPVGKKSVRVTLRLETIRGTGPSDEFYEFLMANGGGDAAFKAFDLLDYAVNEQYPDIVEDYP